VIRVPVCARVLEVTQTHIHIHTHTLTPVCPVCVPAPPVSFYRYSIDTGKKTPGGAGKPPSALGGSGKLANFVAAAATGCKVGAVRTIGIAHRHVNQAR
jgi:hypothetical protein